MRKIKQKALFTLLTILSVGIGKVKAQSYAITNIAGDSSFGFSGDGGSAVIATLLDPMEVSADSIGNVYFTDWGNSRVRVATSNGIISTIAGNGFFGFSGDGGPAKSAELNGPMGVFGENSGNVLISDIGNDRVRKVNTSGIISTIAGTGTYGFSGDGGPATLASFRDPIALAEDTKGDIFIVDVFNSRIRKIDHSTGIITTVVGCGVRGYSGDGGPATLAELYYPSGINLDDSGNIYIADANNFCIRKVTTTGYIYTVAGNGIAGYSGDGGSATSAELNYPSGVAADNSGDIFIADQFNNRIREVSKNGIITTIAGNNKLGYSNESENATSITLYNPTGITIGPQQVLYLADAYNNTIRKLTIAPFISPESGEVTIYPNPSYGVFNIKLQGINSQAQIEVYNILGQRVYYVSLNSTITQMDLSTQSKGVYLYRVITSENEIIARGKVIVL
ncbi:MAG TPA: T9SS type A sorting domain-containing protein [Bacteroidia bacterium]|jgi:hypothetical protein|nr:T9SS type A sorting domain-containing protein [Bacteroidia bacterium]